MKVLCGHNYPYNIIIVLIPKMIDYNILDSSC